MLVTMTFRRPRNVGQVARSSARRSPLAWSAGDDEGARPGRQRHGDVAPAVADEGENHVVVDVGHNRKLLLEGEVGGAEVDASRSDIACVELDAVLGGDRWLSTWA